MVDKSIALLGATGSIGASTLRVVQEQSEHLSLSLMTAHRDWQKLLALASEFDCHTLCLTGITESSLKLKSAVKQGIGDSILEKVSYWSC